MSFWKAFKKEAENKLTQGETAAAVGAGTTATLAAGSSISNIARDVKENKTVAKSHTLKKLMKNLKPGDILLTGMSPKHQEKIVVNVGKKGFAAPLKIGELVQALAGNPHYHGAVYVGNGQVAQAWGEGERFSLSKLTGEKGSRIKAYRPTGASKVEKDRAIHFLRQAAKNKAPYKTRSGLVSQALSYLTTGGPKVKCQSASKGSPIVCNTAITKAYPKQFKREYAMSNEIRKAPGMQIVGRYNRMKTPQALKEKVLTRVVSPVLKTGKYGLLAAGATFGAMKANDYLKK